jgi:serine/threonine protein kinase
MTTSGGPYKLGQRFGPYILEAYLGGGAFKSVYKARHERALDPEPGTRSLPSTVALCFPHHQDAEGLSELEKEFAVVQRLNHPNIARAYALERYEEVSFLVMEYVEGESLRGRLKRVGALPQDQALRVAGLVCEALAYAHSTRTLHRDVKPENVLLTANDAPKLLDFGIARVLTYTLQRASTQIGTVDYMAPEAMQGAASTNADLWALGVMLYEMLTGIRPFAGEVGEVIQKIMTARYDERPLFEKGVDRAVVRVIRKMLQKDPEQRYRAADELVVDLETVARRARLLDDDEGRLEVLIRASIPLICVLSFEEERVLAAVRSIAKRLGEERRRPRALYVWSASRGLRDAQGQLARPDSLEDPTTALDHVIENQEDALYVFLDIHRHYSPVTTRLIRDAARAVRSTRKSLLFISPFFQAPDELQKEIALSVFQLPDRLLLEQALKAVEEATRQAGLPVELRNGEREGVLRAAAGLTASEATLAFRAAAAREGGLFAGAARVVAEVKTQLIRKTGILEYYDQSESFADVGGLGRLLEWFNGRAAAFGATARYAGLPLPKGVLLVGVPGCGKSLSARALAGAWRAPLLRLDVGRIFGPYVGQSEANLRLAIQTAEAVSPCILWIDEVEKGFAGVRGQGGGGVAARVFGTFLNWLQDKRSPVFVVATANDLSGIPPEFLRQGRFDDIFFVGLPTEAERKAIFQIHLAKRKRAAAAFDLDTLAQATEGFSGAEIEQAVNTGLFLAFDAGRELQQADLAAAVADTRPLSRSRGREIAALTAWAQNHAKTAS